MSRNHLHVLVKDPGQWTVSLGGQHVTTSKSQAEAYQQALAKAEELGDAVIFVHDDEGELEFEETYP
ncbi:DUF2188 domain-containing protein [Glutamicibacter sp. BW77]|uniref:DUF2188 domain-containing protein n=1 Tax=Glutamicibacter sp. BW77 TaxID=2024402 RepID=UPI000BB7BA44|nr:DUF2188 domain-containing protein [Glutamicibacter sp. BW77]PCC36252.1 hypothetical protein CIK74_06495 [Glutamicibacter sp. BW77]